MRCSRLFRPSVVFGLVLVEVLAGGSRSAAQNSAKVEIVPQFPHSRPVFSAVFSPDGTRVLSGSGDGTLRLWDVAGGQLIRIFHGKYPVRTVAFSPNGGYVLSGNAGKTLNLWDTASGQLVRTFGTFEDGSDIRHAVAFSPDGAHVLSGIDNTLRLWDVASAQLIRTFAVNSAVNAVAFSPDGGRVISGSSDEPLKLWHVANGQLIRSFERHSDKVSSVAFSPDGTRVLSDGEGRLKLWEVAGGRLIRTFGEKSSDQSLVVAFSPDGTRVLSGRRDGTLELWDAAGGRLIRVFRENRELLLTVAFSPDGTRIVSGGYDGTLNTLKLWDVAGGHIIRNFEGYSDKVTTVAFSPDGRRVLSGSRKGTPKLWDATGGQLIRNFEGDFEELSSVAFSPDGMRVVSGSRDARLKLWDAASGRLIRAVSTEAGIASVVFSRDGSRVLSGSWDGTLKLWDAVNGQPIRTFNGGYARKKNTGLFSGLGGLVEGLITHKTNAVALSGDGALALSRGWGGSPELWDVARGQLIRTFEGHSDFVTAVAFSPDGSRVLTGGWDRTLKLWDVASGQPIRTFQVNAQVTSVAFSRDGTRVLSGSWDYIVRLWNVATGEQIRTCRGHSAEVTSVALSPDGTRVLSGSEDGTARVWDSQTGRLLASLFGSRTGQWLVLTPDGFFTGSGATNDILMIVRGLNVAIMDQVHQSLFSPDLLREALAGDPDGEVAEAAKVINLDKVLDSGPAPSVVIKSPVEGSQLTTDLVEVTARIADRGKGVGRIEWRVNGITSAVTTKLEGGGPVYTVARQLALDPGGNAVEVVAYNGPNLLASVPARTNIKFMGPAGKTKPKLHILAIGINKYVDKGWAPPGKVPSHFGPLALAVKDATAFADNMKKAASSLYDEVRVTLALDGDATRDNLHKVVEKVAAEIHPRDSFILFVAAHGDAENGRFYLIPQDYQSGPPGTLARRAVGQSDLQDWLANRVKARKAIILLDTCESGTLIAGHKRSRTDTPASEAAVGRLHEATGRPVLTAAAAGQFAYEDSLNKLKIDHGLFTWAILDALRNGDSNGNGLIEVSELAAYVQDQVPKLAAKLGGVGSVKSAFVGGMTTSDFKQTARFGSRGEDFAVAAVTKSASGPVAAVTESASSPVAAVTKSASGFQVHIASERTQAGAPWPRWKRGMAVF